VEGNLEQNFGKGEMGNNIFVAKAPESEKHSRANTGGNTEKNDYPPPGAVQRQRR